LPLQLQLQLPLPLPLQLQAPTNRPGSTQRSDSAETTTAPEGAVEGKASLQPDQNFASNSAA